MDDQLYRGNNWVTRQTNPLCRVHETGIALLATLASNVIFPKTKLILTSAVLVLGASPGKLVCETIQ